MKMPKLNIAILLINAALILFIAAKPHQQSFEKITVNEFELVDKQGVSRVSLKIEPDGTVMMRMKDTAGTIRVKLGADDKSSGLVLLNNKTELGVHVIAKEKDSFVKIVNPDGKEQLLKP